MSDSEGEECLAEYGNDKICNRPGKYDDGKCGYHSDEVKGPGPKEGQPSNNDTQKHGVYSDRSNYYERLPMADKAFVDGMVQTFLEDAPFTEDHDGKMEILNQICIDFHKRRQANEYIAEEGLKWEEVTDYYETSEGKLKVITTTEEHYLNITADRLARTNIRLLKELGCLDDPDSQRAENERSFLEILSGDDDE